MFRAVFEVPADPASGRGQAGDPSRALAGAAAGVSTLDGSGQGAGRHEREADAPAVASAVDRLATRDFAELSADELALLTRLMRAITLITPTRPSRQRWSGGTRIGGCLDEFNRRYGHRGLARGAVVLIISDGWDTGDPADLGRQMLRLSRVAFRIVWANPRAASRRYRPLVGGMAAAWAHCDAVVSAHSIDALDALTAALADPVRRRRVLLHSIAARGRDE